MRNHEVPHWTLSLNHPTHFPRKNLHLEILRVVFSLHLGIISSKDASGVQKLHLFKKKQFMPGDSKWPFWDGFLWPFGKVLGDLQLGNQKVTLNHLEFMDIQTSTHWYSSFDIKFTYQISSKTSNTQTLSISDSFSAGARRSSCCKSSEKKNAQTRHSLRSPCLGLQYF